MTEPRLPSSNEELSPGIPFPNLDSCEGTATETSRAPIPFQLQRLFVFMCEIAHTCGLEMLCSCGLEILLTIVEDTQSPYGSLRAHEKALDFRCGMTDLVKQCYFKKKKYRAENFLR